MLTLILYHSYRYRTGGENKKGRMSYSAFVGLGVSFSLTNSPRSL